MADTSGGKEKDTPRKGRVLGRKKKAAPAAVSGGAKGGPAGFFATSVSWFTSLSTSKKRAVSSSAEPEMMSGVLASSMRMLSTSSTMA